MNTNWNGDLARQIPMIPENPVWSTFITLQDYKKKKSSKDVLAVGYDEADAEIYSIPLADIYCYLITGAGRTGKTNFMKIMTQAAIDKNAHVAVLDGPKKDFRFYAKSGEVHYLAEENEIFEYFKKELTPVFQERNKIKNEMLSAEAEEKEIYEVMSEKQPYFIFISDFSWFVSMVYSSEHAMSGFMETLITKGRYHNIYFVAEIALNRFSEVRGYKVFEAFAEYHTGIHFGGKTNDNTIMPFEYMTFSQQSTSDSIGIGRLPGSSNYKGTKKVVVPLARK
jgi:S-DNA-T family DNA segregation ATPase FtsK/SpoIIIE